MKVTLNNHSCSRISRLYSNFELDLPGHTEITTEVPDEHAENLKKFLQVHHPAVVFTAVQEEAAPVAVSLAATITDKTVLDINVDDEEEDNGVATTVITTVERVVEAVVEGSLPSDLKPITVVAAAPEVPAAPAAPEAEKKGRAKNLIPAKPKAKPATTPGGKK